jgi:hypothetical protein
MSLITNKIPGHTSFRKQRTKMFEGYKHKVPFLKVKATCSRHQLRQNGMNFGLTEDTSKKIFLRLERQKGASASSQRNAKNCCISIHVCQM